jgi:predicted ester cyclase
MNKEQLVRISNSQLIDQGNLDAADNFFSGNYIAHAEDKIYKGHEFIKRFTKQIRTALPDISVRKVEFFVNAENILAWQRTLSGTHKKDMMGIPASEKKIIWNEMVISRFEGDKIAEEWVVSELAGQLLLKQPAIKQKTPNR